MLGLGLSAGTSIAFRTLLRDRARVCAAVGITAMFPLARLALGRGYSSGMCLPLFRNAFTLSKVWLGRL